MSDSFVICVSWIREYTGSLSDFDLFIWTLFSSFIFSVRFFLPLFVFIYIWMQNALFNCMNCRLHSSLVKFTVHQMSYFTMPGKLCVFFLFAKSTPFVYVKFFNIAILSSVGLKFSIFLFLSLVYLKALFFTR